MCCCTRERCNDRFVSDSLARALGSPSIYGSAPVVETMLSMTISRVFSNPAVPFDLCKPSQQCSPMVEHEMCSVCQKIWHWLQCAIFNIESEGFACHAVSCFTLPSISQVPLVFWFLWLSLWWKQHQLSCVCSLSTSFLCLARTVAQTDLPTCSQCLHIDVMQPHLPVLNVTAFVSRMPPFFWQNISHSSPALIAACCWWHSLKRTKCQLVPIDSWFISWNEFISWNDIWWIACTVNSLVNRLAFVLVDFCGWQFHGWRTIYLLNYRKLSMCFSYIV